MKKIKKVVMAAMVISAITTSNVFAVIPDLSVLIGEKAYELNYAQDKSNLKEIRNAILQNRYNDIFVKDAHGNWYHEFKKEKINPKSLPDVIYKDKDRNISVYEEGDGEAKDSQSAQYEVIDTKFITENKLHIKFNCTIQEYGNLSIAIDGEELSKDKIKLLDNGSIMEIQLDQNLKEEDYSVNVKIKGDIKSICSDKINLDYDRNTLIINDRKQNKTIPKFYEGNVNVLAPDRNIKESTIQGNLSIYGESCELNNLKIDNSLEIESKKIKIIKTKTDILNVNKDNCEIRVSGLNARRLNINCNSKIILEGKSQIQKTIVNKAASLENISGDFGKVIVSVGDTAKENRVELNGGFQEVLLKAPANIKSYSNSNIKNLTICTMAVKEIPVLDGNFNNVIVLSGIEELNLLKGTKIEKLTINQSVKVNGESGSSIVNIVKNNKAVAEIDNSIAQGVQTGAGFYIGTVSADKEKPVIKLNGESKIRVEVGKSFKDPGVIATDNKDGDITKKVKIVMKDSKGKEVKVIDTSKEGIFTIIYSVKDNAGNESELKRTVEVVYGKDTEAPIIKLNGQPLIELSIQSTFVDPGVIATDNRDGDITDKVKVTIRNTQEEKVEKIDTSKKDTFTIIYTATDATGNTGEARRIVKVVDSQENNEVGPEVYSVNISDKEPELLDKLSLQVFTKTSDKGRAEKAYAVYLSESGKEFGVELKLDRNIYKAEIIADEKITRESWKLSYITTTDLEGNVGISYNTHIHKANGIKMDNADINIVKDTVGPQFISAKAYMDSLQDLGSAKVFVEFKDESGLADDLELVYRSEQGEELRLQLKYKGKFYQGEIKELQKGNWKIDYMVARDKKDNVTIVYNSKIHSLSNTNLSSADINVTEDIVGPKFQSINIDTKKVTEYENTINIKLKATDQSELGKEALLVYINKDNNKLEEKNVALEYIDGQYSRKLNVLEENLSNGTWKISHLVLQDQHGNPSVVYNNKVHKIGEDLSNCDFEYVAQESQLGIKEIKISEKKVQVGSIIKLEVVPMESRIPLKEEAVVKYKLKDDHITKERYVKLNLIDGIYSATIEAEVGQWDIDFIALEDNKGNVEIQYNTINNNIGIPMGEASYKVIGECKLEIFNNEVIFEKEKEAIYSLKLSNYKEIPQNIKILTEVLNANKEVIKTVSNNNELAVDQSIITTNLIYITEEAKFIKIYMVYEENGEEIKTLVRTIYAI